MLPTKSSVRIAKAGVQLSEAVRSRLANAAERHGGAMGPKVRGEKTKANASKSKLARSGY